MHENMDLSIGEAAPLTLFSMHYITPILQGLQYQKNTFHLYFMLFYGNTTTRHRKYAMIKAI